MMMSKIKKLLFEKPGTIKAVANTEEKPTTTNQKKKKRFSALLLKTAMIDPIMEEVPDHDRSSLPPTPKKFSRSSSFLQLSAISAPLKKSRSTMKLGQFYSSGTRSTLVTESAILDYHAASNTAQETAGSENILHTAAVSISSAYSTIHNTATTLHKLYDINNSYKDTGGDDEYNQYLKIGIQFYEKGELEQASYYWKLSAEAEAAAAATTTTEECSLLGTFFYGLALRHGWGCRKSPALAVRYLQKAAMSEEYSIFELQKDMTRFIITAAKIDSLVSLIYEVGEFFWHGWEVPKSVTVASFYFQLASNMGNTDAMNDLAFCYKHGHGLEKNDYKAAQLYRLAEQNGNGLKDNAWIWEEQYNEINCA